MSDRADWLVRLARDPGAFDFHVALRRFETSFRDQPRLGEAVRPADEPLRIAQDPSLSFSPSALEGFEPTADGRPPRLLVAFLGLWGPNGPLPAHLTEYARERLRYAGDATLARFADIFHHRMLVLFHRAWAKSQPTVELDRPGGDAFARYVGAFFGAGLQAARKQDPFPDRAKLSYASLFAPSARNADGLRRVIADHFGLPVKIDEFVGEWMDLPEDDRWVLRPGSPEGMGALGRSAVLGARVWSRAHKFRVVLGPLSPFDFRRMLPDSDGVGALASIVRLYTNDEWAWDIRLVLTPSANQPMKLGAGARLGWTTQVGLSTGDAQNLIIDPATQRTIREAARPRAAEDKLLFGV